MITPNQSRPFHQPALAIGAACVVLALSCTATPTEVSCPIATPTTLSVRIEARLSNTGDTSLTGGRYLSCEAIAQSPTARKLASSVSRIPQVYRPRHLRLVIDPVTPRGLHVAEFHSPSASLFANSRDGTSTSELWLHEISHSLSTGARTQPGEQGAKVTKAQHRVRGSLNFRIERILDEATADYFAAVVDAINANPSTILSVRGSLGRSIFDAPKPGSLRWESLAVPQLGFDEHRFGHSLAGLLFQAEPISLALAADLQQALAKGLLPNNSTVHAQFSHFAARLDPARHKIFLTVLERFLPSALSPLTEN